MTQTTLLPLVLVLAGAVVGFLPTTITQVLQERGVKRSRWDLPLYELASDFARTVRSFTHLAQRLDRSPDQAETLRRLDEQHERLRGLTEQLRILGRQSVQITAREVQRHAFALRRVAEGQPDGRIAEFPETTPDQRVFSSLEDFYKAVRRQLQVTNPDDVAPQPR